MLLMPLNVNDTMTYHKRWVTICQDTITIFQREETLFVLCNRTKSFILAISFKDLDHQQNKKKHLTINTLFNTSKCWNLRVKFIREGGSSKAEEIIALSSFLAGKRWCLYSSHTLIPFVSQWLKYLIHFMFYKLIKIKERPPIFTIGMCINCMKIIRYNYHISFFVY